MPQESHHVAQTLEVYLVRSGEDTAPGEYMAVARVGVTATELALTASSLNREQVKQMLQRVARGVTV